MKKWRVALFLCVALCLAACAALADDHLNVYVSNAELQGGAVSGAYYYVVRADTNLEEFQLGRNDDVSASEPDGWYSPRPDTWYQDEDGSFMIYMPPKRGEGFAESEAIFYRMNDDDAWTRIVLNYDLSKQDNVNIAIENADQPTLLQTYNCVLNWNAVSGVDAYRFTWNMPNGDMGTITTETSVDLSFFYPEFLLGEVGHYECWVDAFKDNQYLHTSAGHTYFDIGPVLSFADYNEDFVIVNDEGNSATMKQNQWMWFTCQTPGAQYVTAHELDEEEEPTDENQFYYGNPDDGGYVDFKWMVVGGTETINKEIVVLAHLEDGSTVESNHLWVTSEFDSVITDEVTFSVPDDVNTVVDGVYQVARDGRLFVDVDNIDANHYGLYIQEEDGYAWIADSHWVLPSDGETTRVPLTVPRCEPREEPYQVHVFAIKYGAEQKDAVATIPIRVTEASDPDSPIIVSMGSEYTVREPLRVFAHYTNPDDIEGHMEIRIVNKDDPNDIPYWGEGGFEDYWDEGGICMHDGDYVVEVMIWNSEGYPQIEFTPAHEFHVNAEGDVAPSEVNTLTVLPQGDDLVLNMSALATDEYAEAEGFYLALQRIDWGWQYLDEMELPAENGEATFTFSGDNFYFEPNGIYKVIVSGYRYGYNSSYTEFRFVVSEASTDNAITLTINGNDDPVQDFLSQENMDVRISWTGEKPTAVRILNGEHWEIWWDDDDYHRDWHFGDGALLMVAEASWTDVDWEHVDWDQFNWNNLDWSAQSNSIRMNVSSPFGPMRAPEVTLDNAELNPIPWGEDLIVNIVDEGPKDEDGNLVDGGWFYGGIEVERKDEDNAWWDYVDFDYRFHSGVNNLTTYCLEPDSNCRVFVGADAVGYNGRDQYYYFSVGERPEETEAVKYFKVNGQTGSLDAMVDDSLPLCAYHSNAEWYNVEITKEGDEGWRDGRSRDRFGMLNDDWGVPESGIYTLNAYAYGRTDEGEEWEDWIGSVQVNATALGRIAEIEINTFAVLPFGEDLALEYSAVPKESDGDDVSAPDWFHLSIERIDWGFENLFEADFDTENGTGSFTISADDMHGYELHGIYKVAISAHKIGFDCYYREFCFVIGDAELPQDLVLTVDGSTDEYQEKLSSQNVYVQVSWTGNEKPTAVRFLNGDNWEYWWGGDNFDRDWAFGDRDFVMYAEATWDDVNWDDVDWENFDWNALNWSAKSNTIRIVITSPRGDMKVPDFSLDNPEFSEGGSQTIPWGEDLILTIHDEAPVDTDGNPVDEGWFNCDIEIERCDENGNRWWEYSNFEYYIYSGVNYLTTYCLDPGSHCRMHIGADGVGYAGHGTSYDFYVGEKPEETGETIKYFKVKGQTEPVNAMVNESLMLSAYHSDAQWYNVEITKEDNEDWHDNRSRDQRGMLNDNWGVPESGIYTMNAYAYGITDEGEEWEDWIGSVQVNATALGRVAEIEMNNVGLLPVGNDLTLDISAVPTEEDGDDVAAAEWFYVRVERIDWGYQNLFDRNIDTEDGAVSVTISGDTFGFEPHGIYKVAVNGNKHGYDPSYKEFWFVIGNPGLAEELTLTVDGSTDEQQERLSGQSIFVKVDWNGDDKPTAVRILNGNNWEYWWDDDNFERDWGFGEDDFVMYAEATWEDVDWDTVDWDSFDWNELNWSAKSNSIRLIYTSPYGNMKAPDITLENDHIAWGEDLVVTVHDEGPTNAGGDLVDNSWFYCSLDVERGDENGTWWERVDFDYHINSGVNRLTTYCLDENSHYRIHIGADAIGYNGRGRSYDFYVGEKPEETGEAIKYFTANGQTESVNAMVSDEITMYAYHSNAQWYNVEITKEDNEDWHDNRSRNQNGLLNDNWGVPESGIYTLKAYAYGRTENGEWEEEIGSITISATAEGRVADIDVDAIHTLTVGDDLVLHLSAVPGGSDGDDVVAADNFYVDLTRVNDGWQFIDEQSVGTENGTATITFGADRFEAGNQYIIKISAQKHRCDEAYTEFRFIAVSEDAEQNLVLLVDDSTDDQTKLSSYSMNVRVEGFDTRPTAIRVMNGDNWEYWWGDDSFERDWSFGDDTVIYAEASWSDVDLYEIDRNGWQDFDWNTDLEWTAHSNVVYITIINPNPQLVAPNFGLENPELGEGGSGVIPWGDDLILNVYDEAPMDEDGNPHYDCWFYGFLHVERYNEYGGYWENANFNPQISSGLNYISTYALEGGCRYSISVGTDGAGYNGRSRSIEFRVGDRTEEQPIEYFTANGESEELEIETNTEFTMYAYYTGAEWYNVVITQEGNDDWHEDKGDTRNGVLCDNWKSQIEGTFYLTAYAYGRLEEADENGNWEWEHEISTITLHVYAPHEDLREPEVEMGDLAYMGGDPIVINFYGPDEAEYFNYWVHSSEDGNWRAGSGRDGIGEAILRTNRLDSGVYWVEFDAQAAGYNQGHATLHFALLDPNDVILNAADGSYYFSVSATEVQTEETVHIVAYMPGTDAIRIFSSRNGDDLEEFDYRDGPGMSTYFNRGDPADFGIYISGHEINGDWTEPVQAATVTYTAQGELEQPHLTINGSDDGYTVTAKTSKYEHWLTISIDPVEHAEYYYFEIKGIDDGRIIYSDFFEATEEGVSQNIEDDRIQPGKLYHVYCDAHATGYVCAGYSRTFMLKPPNVSTDVTLDITPRDSEEFWTAENAHVTAESTGATAIKICMNNEVRYYCGDYVEDNWTIWDDENIFYAFSTTDEIPDGDFDWNELNVNWNKQSPVIPIYANSYGDTLVPTLSFDSPVQKGEWFEFTIEDDGDARQMDIRISDDWGNEIEFRRLWKPGTYRLPIAKMFVGQHYTVWLTCVQSRHKWTEGPRMDLYLEEAQGQNDTYFRVDKDELYPGEPFIPTVYAKDAIHLWVADTDDEAEIDSHLWADWDGEWGTNGADWEWWFNDPGTYQLYAFAQYEENGNRQLIGTVEITVLEPVTLDAPQINVGPVENVNEDTVITIPLVPNAYHYNLMVHQTDMENKRVFRDYKNVNDAENGVITFTIAANELEANASYWCDVYIDPEDGSYAYRGSENHINFMTTRGATINNLEIRLDEAYLDGPSYRIPINTGFNAEITVRLNGSGNRPTAIALCMGDHVWYSFVNGDVENMGLSEYQACPETLYAKACYDDLSDYTSYDDVPWDQLNWSNPTGPVLVTFYAEGYAEPAEIIYSRVIMSGREIYINVTLGEHANEAHANLNRSLESYYEDMVFPYWIGMEDGVIRIPTEGLDCGEYQLYVDSSGEAYQNNRTYGYVRIVENPYESDNRMMLPAGLTEIEAEAFEGIAARAVIIPYGVTSIGSRAFADSNVRLVIIPSSVTSIADDAFDGSNLTIIYGGSMYVEHYANQLEVCFCHIGN